MSDKVGLQFRTSPRTNGNQTIELTHRKDEPKPARNLDGTPVTLATAGGRQCRWMAGQPSFNTPICGHLTVRNTPWCPHHFNRAYSRIAAR